MDDLDRRARRRPGVAFAGALVPVALFLAVVEAYSSAAFADLGRRGGEYGYAFTGVAVGSIVVGLALEFLRPPWNSVGTGLVVGGVLGLVAVVALFVTVLVSWSQLSS
ncbi:hypothetical protein ACFV4N_35650 [Actinosynnema sp. NPDC059797]